MPDYVSKKAVKGAIGRVCYGLVLDEETEKALTDAIDEMQEEDVAEVKHGKWEKFQVVGLPNYHYCFCSVCGAEALQDEYGAVPSKFCPNCGADMRKRKETE